MRFLLLLVPSFVLQFDAFSLKLRSHSITQSATGLQVAIDGWRFSHRLAHPNLLCPRHLQLKIHWPRNIVFQFPPIVAALRVQGMRERRR